MTKHYSSVLLRTLVAFLVGHFLVTPSGNFDFRYLIIFFSTLGVLIATWGYIIGMTRYLNSRFGWMERPLERFMLQMLTAVFLPVGGILTFISIIQHLVYEAGRLGQPVMTQALIAGCFTSGINLVLFTRFLYFKFKETKRVLERDFPYYSNL